MNIKELFLQGSHDNIIKTLKSGRNTPQPSPSTTQKQLDPAQHDINDMRMRPDRWVKVDLDDAEDEDGNTISVTVGDGEGKRTTMRREAVARVALALQKLIVKRAVAFTFGKPIILNAQPKEGTREGEVLKAIKKVLFDNKSRTLNKRVARDIFTYQEVAELWYVLDAKHAKYGFPANKKLRTAILSPANGNKLYPYFDGTGDMIAFSREYNDNNEYSGNTYFDTYTADLIARWIRTRGGTWQLLKGYPKKNTLGKIPVIYGHQPHMEWADVQNLIDRLEKLLSNFADTNDYHASPKIVTKGEILGWSKKGEAGSVIEMDEDGEAEYLSWKQAPKAVRLEIETLLRHIYTITQTADISFESIKGIGNISGVALELLFMDAHLKVQDKMEIFDDYLQRRLAVIQAFLATMNTGDSEYVKACNTLNIEPEIKPYMIKDEKARVESLLEATGQKSIASRRTTVKNLGWIKNIDEEIKNIESDENGGVLQEINQ